MKFLGGIEALQIDATPAANGLRLRGKLAWITNLRKAGFVAAAAVAPVDGSAAMVVSFSHDLPAVERSTDLDLIALRGSNTAAVKLDNVLIRQEDIIHKDARAYLPAVRPAFLSMQCGMSIGLARASLHAASAASAIKQNILTPRIARLSEALTSCTTALLEGVDDRRFETQAAPLFRLRIQLAEIAQGAVNLELQARGGLAYLKSNENSFARRWSEAAFVPIITPSLTQLQTALALQESDNRPQSV